MYLPPSAQDSTATQIANYIRLNTVGYGAVATRVGQAGYPDAAVVAIASTGSTDCTAKVAVRPNKLVYVSAAGTHVTYPIRQEDAARIICAFLAMEND